MPKKKVTETKEKMPDLFVILVKPRKVRKAQHSLNSIQRVLQNQSLTSQQGVLQLTTLSEAKRTPRV